MTNTLPVGDARVFEYLLRLGDERLVLGHRLSEWCGHGPILEEDIALTNIALDLIGQANALLDLAGSVEGDGRDADALAYFREAIDFRNPQIVELPRGDFGFTIARQFLYDVYAFHTLDALQHSVLEQLAGIAAKSLKEVRYHVRHTAEWMRKLGDGTDESHRRIQEAVTELWRFTGELFEMDDVDREMLERRIGADLDSLHPRWDETVRQVMTEASLRVPEVAPVMTGGRRGRHTEHLGHLLAEMQIVARSFPGAQW